MRTINIPIFVGSIFVLLVHFNIIFSIQQDSLSSGSRKTFKRFMQIELWRKPELEKLYPLLCNIENACRDVNRLMRRVSTDNLLGYNSVYSAQSDSQARSVNIQGENQKKLDVRII